MMLATKLRVVARAVGTAAIFCAALVASCSAQDVTGSVFAEVSNSADLYKAAASIRQGSVAGGTIVLRPGMYLVDRPLVFRDNHYINLRGSGFNTVLERVGPGNAIEIERCWFCTLENIQIRQKGDETSGSGVAIRDSCCCEVNQCRIDHFAESAVRFDGISSAPLSSNAVRNCWFQNNRGVQLASRYNNDFYIIGNQFGADGSTAGCVLDHSSAGTYSMNYHWGNKVGLQLGPGSSFNRIENNRFEQSRTSGIIIGTPTSADVNMLCIFNGNTIHTNSERNSGLYSAVVAWDARDFIFTSNQVFSWDASTVRHKSAIELGRGCERWIIKDNTFHNHVQEAITGAGSGGHIIKDNITVAQ